MRKITSVSPKTILLRVFYFILVMAGAAIFREITGTSAFIAFASVLGLVLLGRIAFILITHASDDQPDD